MQAMLPFLPGMLERKERWLPARPRQTPCLPMHMHVLSQCSLLSQRRWPHGPFSSIILPCRRQLACKSPCASRRCTLQQTAVAVRQLRQVVQAAGSAKSASATMHCRLQCTAACVRTSTCFSGPAFRHHMLQTAVSSSADQHLLVPCRLRQGQRQERLRHHALQIADEDFTVRHVDSPLQGQACFSGFDYILNPYQVGLLGCFTWLHSPLPGVEPA